MFIKCIKLDHSIAPAKPRFAKRQPPVSQLCRARRPSFGPSFGCQSCPQPQSGLHGWKKKYQKDQKRQYMLK